MELLPTEAPVYGGGLIVAFLPEDYILPEDIRAYLVFKGTQQRQVTEAKISIEDNAFHAVVPDHEPPERVEVSVYIQLGNSEGKLIGNEDFTYYLDQTCYLARYLADSVHKLYALEDWDSIQGPNFSLEQEDFSTLDERLTSAFQHLILPPHWNLLGDPSIEKIPRETLFHFASRLGLSTFVTLLLEKGGAGECLGLRNRHGELAEDIARERSFDGLADLITDPHAHGVIRWESREKIGENTTLKRQSFGTISTISEQMNGSWPPIEEEISALSATIPPSTPVPHRPDLWPHHSMAYLDESYDPYPFEFPRPEYKGKYKGGVSPDSGEVLSDNLKHLQEISDGIHNLRHKDLERLRESEGQEVRLSTSCPALNHDQSGASSNQGDQDGVYETPDEPSLMVRRRRALPLNLSDEQIEEQIRQTRVEGETYPGDSPNPLQRRHSWHSSESIDGGVSPSQKRYSLQHEDENETEKNSDIDVSSPTLRRVERNNMVTFSLVAPSASAPLQMEASTTEIDAPIVENQRSKSLSMNNIKLSESIDQIERRKTISEGLITNEFENDGHFLALQQFIKNRDSNQTSLTTSSPKQLSLTEFLADPSNFGGNSELKSPPPVPPKPEMGAAARRIVTRKLSFLGKMRSSARSKPKEKKKSFSELKFGNGPRLDEEATDSLDGAIADSNTLKKSNRPSIIQPQRPHSMMISKPAQYDIGNPAYHRDAPVSGTARTRPVSNYSNSSLKSLSENFNQKSNRSSYYEEGDEKEFTTNIYNNLKESGSIESLDEAPAYDIADIESDPDLILRNDEQNWSVSVDKKILKKMQKKDIKRQENIFELIQTERNYLTVLKVMQKIFSRGMRGELRVDQHFVDRLFPLIDEHVDYVAQFVAALNERQAEGKVVERIGDLLVQQWGGDSGAQMKRLFGDFCSRQNEVTSFYKDLMKNDKKFQAFIRKCDKNPLARRMSVPECALFVTQRITKYPIMLQTLCENTVKKDHKEDGADLDRSLELSREIAKDVDEQVQAHEREQLLIEVYEKIESRASTTYDKDKFDRKDMLAKKRKLLYSLDSVQWKIKDAKKFTDVYFLLLSDCIVLLQENNGKYNFPSGQPAAIPLSKLIVREVAGDEKSLYLMSISTEQMYTLKVTSGEERKTLPQKIQIAANNCPDEYENISEDQEERRLQDEKCEKMRSMFDQLESKDALINKLLTEKMALFVGMAGGANKDNHYTYPTYHSSESENGNNSKIPPCTPSLLKAIEQVKKLSESLLGESPRPTGSPGDRLTPQLPRRSDTFGGFDNGKENPASARNTWHSSQSDSKLPQLETSTMTSSSSLFNRDSGLVDSDVMVQRTDSQNSIPQAWGPDREENPATGSSDTFVTPRVEQVAALTEIAHLLNLHVSVAAQQDTRAEKLEQLLRESREKPQQRRKAGSLQEVELKRSQIKQQEQLSELRRQQQALRSERGQWDRQYERFQRSMEAERKEVEEEKKRLISEKEENDRQRDENQKNKEDYQREMSRLRELQRKHNAEQPLLPALNRNNSSNQIGDNLSKSHLTLPTTDSAGKPPSSPTYAAGEYPRTFPGLKRDPGSQPPANQVPLHLQYSATNQLARTQGPKHQEIPSKLSNLSSKQHGKNSKLAKLSSGPQSSTNLRNKTSIKGMFRNNSHTNFLQASPTEPRTNHVAPNYLIDSSSRDAERKSPSLREKLKNETELFL